MATQIEWKSYPFIAPSKYAGKLTGKVALVTGTSSGIGKSIAKALAAAGASVACVARREAELQANVKEINSSGGRAIAIVADVAQRGAPMSIIAQVEKELGPIDFLINNAGRSRIGPVVAEDEDLDLWWGTYELNVRAPVAMVRAALPGMIERKSGIVLTISSGVNSMALPVMTAYASSKAAITKFHELLQIELEGTGVDSFTVCPGIVGSTELGKADSVRNTDPAALNHPATQKFMNMIKTRTVSGDVELSADTVVAVCADPRYRAMRGKFIISGENQEPILDEIEKEDGGKIDKEMLYRVHVGQLLP